MSLVRDALFAFRTCVFGIAILGETAMCRMIFIILRAHAIGLLPPVLRAEGLTDKAIGTVETWVIAGIVLRMTIFAGELCAGASHASDSVVVHTSLMIRTSIPGFARNRDAFVREIIVRRSVRTAHSIVAVSMRSTPHLITEICRGKLAYELCTGTSHACNGVVIFAYLVAWTGSWSFTADSNAPMCDVVVLVAVITTLTDKFKARGSCTGSIVIVDTLQPVRTRIGVTSDGDALVQV